MICTAVRDRMPELALGSLPAREALVVDRHLSWCAACRKEAGDLHGAAGLLPYALAPVVPPEDLEERVVAVVREAAGGLGSPATSRRGHSAGAAVIAALVAVAALGWGAVMAGRADRFRDQARHALEAQALANERLADFFRQQQFQDPHNDVFLGTLAAPPGSAAGGAVLALTSPSGADFAIVSVNGLSTEEAAGLPFTVTLESTDGESATVGKIDRLDTGGGSDVGRRFKRDLSGLTHVLVRDADGNVVMFGTLTLRDAVPSPSP